jgi:hypothetical protein
MFFMHSYWTFWKIKKEIVSIVATKLKYFGIDLAKEMNNI